MRRKTPFPRYKKFYEVQSDINLTGHITDALLTIVGGPAWDAMSEADQAALSQVTKDTAVCATDAIIKAESELAEWFRGEGVQVNEVDRGPFIEAVKVMHNGEMATWDQVTYDRLQAIE
jgi:TRAP-type C4-dicarboxylate transport system substrate-binding protein